MSGNLENSKISFSSPVKENWSDVERLFGERGACGGCWCMYPRLSKKDFEEGKGAKNKSRLKKLITSGEQTGLIAYYEKEPIGWIACAPREVYLRFEKSRTLKRIDEQPVWSIVCFFVKKEYRNKGVSLKLINAAVDYCRKQGATIVEAYPVEPYAEKMPAAFAWRGFPSSFEKAGFTLAAQRSKTRPIYRFKIS